MGRLASVLALGLAVLVGYLIGTSPPGVTPPHVPDAGSPMTEVPPWPIFRVAVGLNDFFRAAWEATTLPKVRVIELSTAKWHSQVIYALTKNGIFDAVHETPLSCQQTAAALGLYQPFLCRLMAAGATLGLLQQGGDGAYGTTATSSLLLSGIKGGQKAFVEMINNPEIGAGWDAIGGESLTSGKGGFETAYGESFWSRISRLPHLEKQFDAAMSSFTAAAAGSIISSYSFPPNGTLCDVGGSEAGTLRLLLEHYPAAQGIVLDRPTVAERATATLAAAGFGDRARGVGGDFLGTLPSELGACDAFVLKHILHDWDDEHSVQILKAIKAVAKPGAKLAVVEHVLGVSGAGMERAKAMMDLNMMASCESGAKERSVEEYQALFTAAGLHGTAQLLPMRDILSLIEVEL